MNIVLIGYRCSGKTQAGKVLARDLGREFMDIDDLIERKAGIRIPQLVASEGWAHFRSIEKDCVQECCQRDGLVIATGGGAVLDTDNVQRLRTGGWLVWLKTDALTLKKRMARELRADVARPSLTAQDPVSEIDVVLEERTPLYKKASHAVVDTSEASPQEVAFIIARTLDEHQQSEHRR